MSGGIADFLRHSQRPPEQKYIDVWDFIGLRARGLSYTFVGVDRDIIGGYRRIGVEQVGSPALSPDPSRVLGQTLVHEA